MRTTMFSTCSLSVVSLVLLITLLTATLTGVATVGVDYGRNGDNLPKSQIEVVDLYKSHGIGAMRIYSGDEEVLQALRGSDIELMLGVLNEDLQKLGDASLAREWVQRNVLNFFPDVKIKYIAVGNEVSPVNGNSQFAQFLVPAMTNIFNAVKDAGLFQVVFVSTSLDTTVIETPFPPSAGTFRSDLMGFMNPIIGFLTDTNAPIMFSIYPYFAYIEHYPNITLSYASFRQTLPEFTDMNNGLQYFNLFDAMLDGVHSALERASGSSLRGVHSALDGSRQSLRVIVTETGWPSHGRPGPPVLRKLLSVEEAPTIENACTYNQNLISHVTSSRGTPKRPGDPIKTYIFAMFDENLKTGAETENYFGLFDHNKENKCGIDFHGT